MILIYSSDLHLSIKLSFAFKHLKVLNQFFAPFQCETNKLCDLCWNISLSPTALEKCPVQQPPPEGHLAGWNLRLLICLVFLRGAEEKPARGCSRCSLGLLNINHWSVLHPLQHHHPTPRGEATGQKMPFFRLNLYSHGLCSVLNIS